MSEIMRKDFYYDCIMKFTKALSTDEALIGEWIKIEILRLRSFFMSHDMFQPQFQEIKLGKGELRRFCALIYLFTRQLLTHCDMML